MRVLIISLDKNLLGIEGAFGDAQDRHKLYGKYVEQLDIIVFNTKLTECLKLDDNIKACPTNSKTRFHYVFDAVKVGRLLNKDKKIDLIVCQDPFLTGLAGVMLKRKTGAKLIIHSHGDFFGNWHWLKEDWFNLPLIIIGTFVIRGADAIRAVSKGVAKKFIEMGFKKNMVNRISTPVNLEKFSSFNNKKVEAIKGKYHHKKIVFFVGRLVQAKNISVLIDAFKDVLVKYNKAVLLIAGSGPQEAELKEKIKAEKLEDQVVLLGAIDHDDLPNYYKACNIFVLPSTNESFGKVLLEAAAAKKPSVASSTNGAQEIILEGETGFIVPIGDKDKLSNRMLKLLKDGHLAHSMGEKAHDHAYSEYGWKKNTEKIINMWKETIKK
jgi:1,2-diacylglycerol 3-alpha-glucosyltransferase